MWRSSCPGTGPSARTATTGSVRVAFGSFVPPSCWPSPPGHKRSSSAAGRRRAGRPRPSRCGRPGVGRTSSSWSSRRRRSRPRTPRGRCRCSSSAASDAPSSSARRSTSTGRGTSSRGCSSRTGSRQRSTSRRSPSHHPRSPGSWLRCRPAGAQLRAARAELARAGRMSDTLVFIPAWNEEENLPAVLDGLRRCCPNADVLVVDDGSTDRTADVAREHGAEVLSFGENQGPAGRDRHRLPLGARARLRLLRARRRRRPASGGRSSRACSRSSAPIAATSPSAPASSPETATSRTATGRAPPGASARSASARDGRRAPTPLRRCDERALRGNAKALPLLAEPFETEAPEVEALIRIVDAGLRLEEVPVNMAPRAGGESKLRGSKAVKVVVTVALTLVAAKLVQARRKH